MAYHKVTPQLRQCAHCQREFLAPHQRRIYCSNSCNTRAYNARQAVKKAGLATSLEERDSSAAAPAAGGLTLDWSKQNLLVLGTASALGQLGVQLGTSLLKLFTKPVAAGPADVAQRPDPLAWLPAGLLTAAAPRVVKEIPTWQRSFVFVELHYLGHVLYYQPRERWLLWRVVPGKLVALLSPAYLDALAEQVPYEAEALGRLVVEQARPLQPKFLG